VLQGGGNLGNVYPNESGLRLRLLRDFPGRRIVQLPQSIWFTAAAAVEEWRQAFARHGNFALLVRDERSRDFARRRLGLEAVLCPDTSCALAAGELLPCPPPPDLDMLWLWRTDRESGGDTPPAVSGLRMDARDWPELELRGAPASGTIRHRAAAIHAELVRRRHLWTARIWWRLNGPSWEALARARVRRGLALLARGRVVITNRLHAGLLGEQIGRPVIFCPNANGKLRDYLDTWPGTSEPRRWAETPADALRQARALLDGAAEGAWDEKGGRVRGSG